MQLKYILSFFIFLMLYTISIWYYFNHKMNLECYKNEAIRSKISLDMFDKNLTNGVLSLQAINLKGFFIYIGKNNIINPIDYEDCKYFNKNTQELVRKYSARESKKISNKQKEYDKYFNQSIEIINEICKDYK